MAFFPINVSPPRIVDTDDVIAVRARGASSSEVFLSDGAVLVSDIDAATLVLGINANYSPLLLLTAAPLLSQELGEVYLAGGAMQNAVAPNGFTPLGPSVLQFRGLGILTFAIDPFAVIGALQTTAPPYAAGGGAGERFDITITSQTPGLLIDTGAYGLQTKIGNIATISMFIGWQIVVPGTALDYTIEGHAYSSNGDMFAQQFYPDYGGVASTVDPKLRIGDWTTPIPGAVAQTGVEPLTANGAFFHQVTFATND